MEINAENNSKRLKSFMEIHNLKPVDIAKVLSKSDRQVRNWLDSTSTGPSDAELFYLEANFGSNFHNPVIGLSSNLQTLPKGIKIEDLSFVPLYTESASAGFGEIHIFWDTDPSDFMAFTRNWLIKEVRINPDDAFVAEVRGDSMKPMLKKGDLVLCERAEMIDADGIYVVCWNNRLMIKHVQLTVDPQIYILRSEDSRNYPEQEVNLHKPQSFFSVGKYRRRITE